MSSSVGSLIILIIYIIYAGSNVKAAAVLGCKPGQYLGTDFHCYNCSEGLYQNEEDKSSCKVCPFGMKSAANRTHCIYDYAGCYLDIMVSSSDYQHNLSTLFPPGVLENCMATCIGYGKNYTAIKEGEICYCVDSLKVFPSITEPNECKISCPVLSNQSCGGQNVLSVYRTPYRTKYIHSPDGFESDPLSVYGITAAGREWFSFQVKGCDDAYIRLMKIEGDYNKVIEIVLGEGSNTGTLIRNRFLFGSLCSISKADLDCYRFRPFWIGWENNHITVGDTLWRNSLPYIECDIPENEVFPINFIEFGSYTTDLCWIIYTNSTTPSEACSEPDSITTVTTTPGFLPTVTASFPTVTVTQTPASLSTVTTTLASQSTVKPDTSEQPANTQTTQLSTIGTAASVCQCPVKTNISEQELREKIQKIKDELLIDSRKTRKFERRFICAEDPRPSAMQMGALLGPVVLSIVIVSLTLKDLIHIVVVMKDQLHRLKQMFF